MYIYVYVCMCILNDGVFNFHSRYFLKLSFVLFSFLLSFAVLGYKVSLDILFSVYFYYETKRTNNRT